MGVPSSRNDVQPFLDSFRTLFPTAQDWTSVFKKDSSFRAASGAGYAAALAAIRLVEPVIVTDVRTLLVVDDSLATVVSAAAVVGKLRESGLPADTHLLLATPLWIDPK